MGNPRVLRTVIGATRTEELVAVLHVHLLDDFRLAYRGTPLTSLDTPRLQSLLAYLILHRDAPQRRQRLSFLFWPDSEERQSRTNLRQLLHHLRNALPEPDQFLQVGASTLQWRPDGPFTLDVAEFEGALVAANTGPSSDPRAVRRLLERTVDLYKGDLLPGCYDEWVVPHRERLREECRDALERLVALLERERDYSAAVRHAEHLLRHDPLAETTYEKLMRLHALGRNRGAALHVYDRCAAVLGRELGVEPGLAIRTAHERLLRIDAPGEDRRATAVSNVPLALVGRVREWAHLRSAWTIAHRGKAQVVLISGVAGIGKTRLAEELLQWADLQGIAVARARSYAAEGSLAYGPVTEWLRAAPLRAALPRLDPVWLAEVTRLLPELRERHTDLPPAAPLTNVGQPRHFFEALARALLASDRPLLLLLDDLQWCDRESLEWLRFLLRFAPTAPLLILGTVRPEETAPDHPVMPLVRVLGGQGQAGELALTPLNEVETARLATNVAGRELVTHRADRLYRETEGNPFFVVETVRAELLGGDGDGLDGGHNAAVSPSLVAARCSLPATVYAVISTRLERLSRPARHLAALAGTVGRAFTLEVLARASDASDESVAEQLEELCRRHIVREHHDGSYDFTHGKLREVAYAQTNLATRRLLHRRTADALVSIHGRDIDSVCGQIAAHYDEARMLGPALQHYRRAAELAQHRYGYAEAARYLRRSLTLLPQLPRSTAHDAIERDLQIALALSLVPLKGYGAGEIRAIWDQVLARPCSPSDLPAPPVLRTMALGHLAAGDLARAHELGGELLDQAQRLGDRVVAVEGHYVLGVVSFWQGHFVNARDHLERSLTLYDRHQRHHHLTLYAQDPAVICRIRLALCLWYLGSPEDAASERDRALSDALELAHPLSTVYALSYASWVSAELGDRQAVQEQTEQAIAVAEQSDLRFWFATNIVMRGWVRAEQGDLDTGIALMRQGIAEQQALRQPLHLPYAFVLLARACAGVGDARLGASALREAECLMCDTGIAFLRSELQRLRGVLELMTPGGESRAEHCFRDARETARGQGSRSLALRATLQWRRLLARRRKDGHVA